MLEEIGFHSWFIVLSDTQFEPVILTQDSEDIILVSYDSNWFLSEVQNPGDSRNPFPVKKGIAWSHTLLKRRTRAGTVIAYVRGEANNALLHCYANKVIPGVL